MKTLSIFLLSFFFTTAHASPQPARHQWRALVYNGPGACPEGCGEATKAMAIRAGLVPTLVDENTITEETSPQQVEALFQDVAVWMQPGGFSDEVMNSISDNYRSAVENFVKVKGGGYVGFCAGEYTSTKISGTGTFLGFNVMSGYSRPYEEPGELLRIMPITWNNKVRQLFFQGGPYLAMVDSSTEIIATYPDGKVAAARAKQGKGKVFVTGLHPEAPQWWRDFLGLKDSDGVDFDLVDEMLHWVTQ